MSLIDRDELIEKLCWHCNEYYSCTLIDDKTRMRKCLAMKIIMGIKEQKPQISINAYDVEEIHENCTVQILKNTVTGEISVGWWENDNFQ